jgi:hypothetical protein
VELAFTKTLVNALKTLPDNNVNIPLTVVHQQRLDSTVALNAQARKLE